MFNAFPGSPLNRKSNIYGFYIFLYKILYLHKKWQIQYINIYFQLNILLSILSFFCSHFKKTFWYDFKRKKNMKMNFRFQAFIKVEILKIIFYFYMSCMLQTVTLTFANIIITNELLACKSIIHPLWISIYETFHFTLVEEGVL